MSVAAGRVGETLARTRVAVGATVRRRDARLVFAGVAAGYLLVYLFAVGDLSPGGGEVGVVVARDPLATAFQPVGAFAWESVALVELGAVTLLFSPLDTLLGAGLAGLVGLNLAVTYLAWRQPSACGLDASAGLFAGLPALFSGAACCGPVLLVALGVQASSVVVSAFGVLVPVAAAMLVGSLLYVGRKVDPAAL